MTSPNPDPGTEPLPDYHELIISSHRQYSKDTFELRTTPRSIYQCLLFLCYTAIALSSWVVFCYIGRGPVPDGYWEDLSRFRDPANGPRDFKAASVLATVAAILTLPTAAAICAYAAVPFAQYHAKGQKLTLRQTVALANQDWMSPLILPTILIPSRNRTYGSHFLYFASFLTTIGMAIWPVQQGFLAQPSITKYPLGLSYDSSEMRVTDIPQLVAVQYARDYTNQDVIRLRKSMESWLPSDCNSHLWLDTATTDMAEWRKACARGQEYGHGFGDLFSNEPSPFVAQMPYGFNTGFERNFIPRFNTSIQYENVTGEPIPDGCFSEDDSADFINHQYAHEEEDSQAKYRSTWHLQSCISKNALITPLKNDTRDRQDFEEIFYLNVSIWASSFWKSAIYKVSANTTVGYFELPNYYNNETQGPLLEAFTLPNETRLVSSSYPESRGYETERATYLEQVQNRGPLASIYTALFGNGSFIDAFTSSNYLDYLNSTGGYRTWHEDYGYVCQAIVPLGRMIEFSGSGNDDYGANTCIVPTESRNLQQIQTYVAGWLHNFFDEPGMAAALRMAAFMANDILLNNPGRSGGLYVSVDEGRDMLAPVMPIEGVIAGSVLLGIFLVSLLGLVVFALRMPRWTDRLDATATLQMGAAMALSTEGLAKMRGMNGVKANTPGFVGDALPDGDIGRIAVGAENSLRRNQKYEAELCAVMPQ